MFSFIYVFLVSTSVELLEWGSGSLPSLLPSEWLSLDQHSTSVFPSPQILFWWRGSCLLHPKTNKTNNKQNKINNWTYQAHDDKKDEKDDKGKDDDDKKDEKDGKDGEDSDDQEDDPKDFYIELPP